MRSRQRSGIWMLFALMLSAPPSSRALENPTAIHAKMPTLSAVQAKTLIAVDGKLNDVAWTDAPVHNGFRQQDPKEGEAATEQTEVRVAYDDDAIYVGLRLYDQEPQRI